VSLIRRHYFRRVLSPINRMRLTPDAVARTMLFGLMWGLSPTVGFQIIGLKATWILVDRWLGFPFNYPIALLLTGVTNPLTVSPIYGLYFVVGCRMTDCEISGFGVRRIVDAIAELDFIALFTRSWETLAEPLGIILLGSVPFIVAGSGLGYYLGRGLGAQLQRRRETREKTRKRRGSRLSRRPEAS